jgi:hypothetical protein
MAARAARTARINPIKAIEEKEYRIRKYPPIRYSCTKKRVNQEEQNHST